MELACCCCQPKFRGSAAVVGMKHTTFQAAILLLYVTTHSLSAPLPPGHMVYSLAASDPLTYCLTMLPAALFEEVGLRYNVSLLDGS